RFEGQSMMTESARGPTHRNFYRAFSGSQVKTCIALIFKIRILYQIVVVSDDAFHQLKVAQQDSTT
ncbi:MAG: hypothetical protein Q9157_005609, partial [Trypethelium eluteriae]